MLIQTLLWKFCIWFQLKPPLNQCFCLEILNFEMILCSIGWMWTVVLEKKFLIVLNFNSSINGYSKYGWFVKALYITKRHLRATDYPRGIFLIVSTLHSSYQCKYALQLIFPFSPSTYTQFNQHFNAKISRNFSKAQCKGFTIITSNTTQSIIVMAHTGLLFSYVF